MKRDCNGPKALKWICSSFVALAAMSCGIGQAPAQEALAAVRVVQEFGPLVRPDADLMDEVGEGDVSGYLFLDGEYVPPPYDIRVTEDDVEVNGRKIADLLSAYSRVNVAKRA